MVMTHTARRSFCTNMYLIGVPILSIMAMSGHKSEKSFLRYIKAKDLQHANIMRKTWEDYAIKTIKKDQN